MGLHLKGIAVVRMKTAALQAGAEVYDAVGVQGHAAVAKGGPAATSAAKGGLFGRHVRTLNKAGPVSRLPRLLPSGPLPEDHRSCTVPDGR